MDAVHEAVITNLKSQKGIIAKYCLTIHDRLILIIALASRIIVIDVAVSTYKNYLNPLNDNVLGIMTNTIVSLSRILYPLAEQYVIHPTVYPIMSCMCISTTITAIQPLFYSSSSPPPIVELQNLAQSSIHQQGGLSRTFTATKGMCGKLLVFAYSERQVCCCSNCRPELLGNLRSMNTNSFICGTLQNKAVYCSDYLASSITG